MDYDPRDFVDPYEDDFEDEMEAMEGGGGGNYEGEISSKYM